MAVNQCGRPTPALPSSPLQPPAAGPIPELLEPVTLSPPLPAFARLRGPSQLSLPNAFTLYFAATLCRASYAPTNAQMYLAATSAFGVGTTITFVPNTSATVPGYAIIVTPSGEAVVVISGTTNLNQWLEQSLLSTLVYTGYNLNDNAQAANVYVTAANAIDAALTPLCPLNKHVLITGHSMGGAVAQVLRYKQEWNGREGNASIITFAQPKAGTQALAEGVNSGANSYARLIIEGDVVPTLPPATSLFLGPFLAGLSPPLQASLAYWNEFQPPNTAPLYLSGDGTLTYGSEPSILSGIVSAVISVNLGQPIQTAAIHALSAYVSFLLQGLPSFQTLLERGWASPSTLLAVNNTLSNMGL